MRRVLLSALLVMWSALAAAAGAQLTIALDLLRVSDLIEVMRIEGAEYAENLNTDLLDGQGGALWQAQVRDIYDPARMEDTVVQAFAQISDTHLRQINLFFGSGLGAEIVALEIAARQAMMDDTVEDMAQDAYAATLKSDPGLLAPLQMLVDVGDMIGRNVTGAMTANYRFYRGMVDGGAIEMTDDEILADTWAQEADIRTDTERWLMGFLMLCYQPLDAEEFQTYLTFSQTPAGRALNAAIFEGFNQMYADISYALGRSVALNMKGSDL